jgi:hypothetical protein
MGWIVSARYDTIFFTASLLVPALLWGGFQAGFLTGVAVFVIFQLAFNMPHNFQTWTLTVLDEKDRARNGRAYLWALAAMVLLFVVPMLAAPTTVFPWMRDALLYWGYYHLIRQFYGFQRLYERKMGGVSARESFWVGRYLDAVSYLPLLFRFRDPDLMTIRGGDVSMWIRHPVLPRPAFVGLLALYGAVLIAIVAAHLVWEMRGRQRLWPRALLLLSVTLCCGAASLINEVLIAVSLLTTFHNLQYVGLVWFHNRNRARRGEAAGNALVGWIAKDRVPLYVAVSMLYGVAVIAPLAIFPGRAWAEIPITLVVAMHYYVDGRAWRFKEVPERALYLALR